MKTLLSQAIWLTAKPLTGKNLSEIVLTKTVSPRKKQWTGLTTRCLIGGCRKTSEFIERKDVSPRRVNRFNHSREINQARRNTSNHKFTITCSPSSLDCFPLRELEYDFLITSPLLITCFASKSSFLHQWLLIVDYKIRQYNGESLKNEVTVHLGEYRQSFPILVVVDSKNWIDHSCEYCSGQLFEVFWSNFTWIPP